jgi:hypothetical protein
MALAAAQITWYAQSRESSTTICVIPPETLKEGPRPGNLCFWLLVTTMADLRVLHRFYALIFSVVCEPEARPQRKKFQFHGPNST